MSVIPSHQVDFREYLKFVGEQASQDLRPAGYWREAVIERLVNGVRRQGDCLPWSKSHATFRLRSHELTVWGGYSGAGKSLLLGQVLLWLLPGAKVAIASFEMPPAATLVRLLRQATGAATPSEAFAHRWLTWADSRLWLVDSTDTVERDLVLGICYYVSRELGCQHIAIDSLVKCGLSSYEALDEQKAFVDHLAQIARDTGLHIHLVHHLRKGQSEDQPPGKLDLRGAGEIADLADNVVLIWRNKPKERQAREGQDVSGKPDAQLLVVKQRHGEWEGKINLWYDAGSLQYRGDERMGALPWPDPQSQMDWVIRDDEGDGYRGEET